MARIPSKIEVEIEPTMKEKKITFNIENKIS